MTSHSQRHFQRDKLNKTHQNGNNGISGEQGDETNATERRTTMKRWDRFKKTFTNDGINTEDEGQLLITNEAQLLVTPVEGRTRTMTAQHDGWWLEDTRGLNQCCGCLTDFPSLLSYPFHRCWDAAHVTQQVTQHAHTHNCLSIT